MCTRFVYNGNDMITGFNFDIDLAVWKTKVIKEKERFYIGILRPDGIYHSYHGVNRNGNVGTLLYVHGNPDGIYQRKSDCVTIADLTEQYIKAQISFDEVLQIVKSKQVTYAPDATMQAMLSDVYGRVLIIEPGIGYQKEYKQYSLITNYSLIKPESTKAFVVQGDDRYEQALQKLKEYNSRFSIADAFHLLYMVHQEGRWATRVSFVYSAKEQTVYYVENNHFKCIKKFAFPL
ncbi:MAG: conjugal transfer protein [Clostridiales bacterium]|nr:conjugal transfer protein [Clostridiales bacterium]